MGVARPNGNRGLKPFFSAASRSSLAQFEKLASSRTRLENLMSNLKRRASGNNEMTRQQHGARAGGRLVNATSDV